MNYLPVLEEIKNRISIVDKVGKKLILKKSGKDRYVGLCPFHSEGTPSFYVWETQDNEHFYCFGCHAKGDVIEFVGRIEGWSFWETLNDLAREAGIQLPDEDADKVERERAKRQEKEELYAALSVIADFYSSWMTTNRMPEPLAHYLEERYINSKSLQDFKLGFGPAKIDFLLKHLKANNIPLEVAKKAGVLYQDGQGTWHDRFSGRLVLPILDSQGKVVSFGGRVVPSIWCEREDVKYMNGPDTLVFDKGSVLYGLDKARVAVRKQGAVIVEGYLDTVIAHQFGFTNVVGLMGTALTARSIETLKRFTNKAILALDADAAGASATERGIAVIRESSRLEEHSETDIKIVILPAGKDPDELIVQGDGVWEKALGAAMPVVEYYFEVVAKSHDLNTAFGKREALDKLTPFLLEVEDSVKLAHYLERLSSLLKISVEVLRESLYEARSGAKPSLTVIQGDAGKDDSRFTEIEDSLLAMVLRYYPASIEATGNDNIGLDVTDFDRPENKLLFERLLQYIMSGEASIKNFADFVGDDEDMVRHLDTLRRIASKEPALENRNVVEAVSYRINRLRRNRLKIVREDFVNMLEDDLPDEELDNVIQAIEEVKTKQQSYEEQEG